MNPDDAVIVIISADDDDEPWKPRSRNGWWFSVAA